ncbi:dihydroorotate dehydrogenase electron transfer subunit [Patescibacteria group bacterium]|nr:MAG: dihydroorotate dehydrogenase electron transfer subunit [Patescibacteria group bacterium]
MDSTKFLKIEKITDETPFVKTFYFNHRLNSKPGQFVMLWLPGIDQKPFSIGWEDENGFALTVFNRGPTTNKLFEMKAGERVGISGPYGTSFSVRPNTRYIMVAGGYGAAPLSFLAKQLSVIARSVATKQSQSTKIDFLLGARSAEHVLFEDRLSKLPNTKIHIATDDGSKGHKGFVTDLLSSVIPAKAGIHDNSLDARFHGHDIFVCTCGPELMEKKVLDACNVAGVECEISIERYMKCGVGVCGQCAVDDLGLHMCKEGPVVSGALASQIKEFGVYHRDKSGKKVYFEN